MEVKKSVSHNPGDIVKLGGIEFVVLDNNMAGSSSEEETLFILALKSQGRSRFGKSNNYGNSDLLDAVCDWQDVLANNGVDIDAIKTRVLDLTTLDGYKGYGSMRVKTAPLTMDEARKYADVIPDCDEATWLSTGWGGPERGGSTLALCVYSDGSWNDGGCSVSYGVRPALVISSSLLDSEKEEVDITEVPTEKLLDELRRRIEGDEK